MAAYTIDFEPVGRREQCQDNETLLACARRCGIGIRSLCGGNGTCHSCKVQVLSGAVSKPTSNEIEVFTAQELKGGYRLACQTYPTSDCKLLVPPESISSPQRAQVEGLELSVRLDPPVRTYHLELPPPSLSDQRGDAERVLETLNQQVQCHTIDIEVLRSISSQLRSWNWQAQASVRNKEVIALDSSPSRQLGLAVDLGTTKIAGYLVDLSNGHTLAAKGIMNPQISYGEDVVSRISYVMGSPKKGRQMSRIVVKALNELAGDLCADIDSSRGQIVESVIVGNTAIHHLLLRLPVKQLAYSPFLPAVSEALDIKARDIGLHIAPGAYVHLLPNIAGFVGADHVAMLLAAEVNQADGLSLVLDIGTNTEVCLASDGKMTSVSCASGPAFEGGHIKDGMRAAGGAIEHFRMENGEVQFQTVDGAPPVGICGSGILDTLAQLYLNGVLSERGRMMDNHPRVRTCKGQREFVIVNEEERDGRPAITITQQDVRELQLAKAAIQTGIQVLLEAEKRSKEDIKQVIIAGAFGTYLDVSSAVVIGMLPSLPLNCFRQVGNAAGMGAKLALLSCDKRAEAQSIARQVGYIELATAPRFMPTFVEAMYIRSHKDKGG